MQFREYNNELYITLHFFKVQCNRLSQWNLKKERFYSSKQKIKISIHFVAFLLMALIINY